jgi:pilus assembly protein Flp/PilA
MRQVMTSLMNSLRAFARAENGATAIEYALIAGGISIVILTAVTSIGSTLNNTFGSVKSGLPS